MAVPGLVEVLKPLKRWARELADVAHPHRSGSEDVEDAASASEKTEKKNKRVGSQRAVILSSACGRA